MATIINKDEERPQLIVPQERNKYASKYESIVEEQILRDVKQTKKHTIMTMTLNEIVENTIETFSSFPQEYKKHFYRLKLKFHLNLKIHQLNNLLHNFL